MSASGFVASHRFLLTGLAAAPILAILGMAYPAARVRQAPQVIASGKILPATALPTTGYVVADGNGDVFPFGDARRWAALSGKGIGKGVVGIVMSPYGLGYWLVNSRGLVVPFGSAQFYGDEKSPPLSPVVGIAAPSNGRGYWLVTANGTVYSFGSAAPFGDEKKPPASPVVAITAVPEANNNYKAPARGYWLVTASGTVFPFGEAGDYGDEEKAPASPVIGMASAPNGAGYWLVTASGIVYPFGAAGFQGDETKPPTSPVVGIAAAPDGNGYWLVTAKGEVFPFGSAHAYGSVPGNGLKGSAIDITDTLWGVGVTAIDDIDANRQITDVSCASATWCMAVDNSGYAIKYSGGVWHKPVVVDPGSLAHGDLGQGEIDAVSCPTTKFCMAVSYLDGYIVYQSGTWKAPVEPSSAPGSFFGVSCGSVVFCMAVADNLPLPTVSCTLDPLGQATSSRWCTTESNTE